MGHGFARISACALAPIAATLGLAAPLEAAQTRQQAKFALYLDVGLLEDYGTFQPESAGSDIGIESISRGYLTAQFALTRAELTAPSTIEPDSVEGKFVANYFNPGLGETCSYTGEIGGSNSAGTLNIVHNAGTGIHFEIQWPAFPGQWNQSLFKGPGTCQPTFNLNPLEGTTVRVANSTLIAPRSPGRPFKLLPIRGASLESNAARASFFNNALGFLNLAAMRNPPEEAAEELAMGSTTEYSDGELYITRAAGAFVESTKSLPEQINATVPLLPGPSQSLESAFGTSRWRTEERNVFNSLQSVSFDATVTKSIQASAAAIVKILHKRKR